MEEATPRSPDVINISDVDSTPLDPDDHLLDVQSELIPVAPKWRNIGLALRLKPDILENIDTHHSGNPHACLLSMVTEWLKRNYDVKKFGEPTWQRLVEAMDHPAGGANTALARRIAGRHKATAATSQELSKAVVFARENRQLIMHKFAAFQSKVCNRLLKNGVDIEQFRQFVKNQFPPGNCIPPPPASLTEIFDAITYHGLWDYFHYSPLVRILKTFSAGDPEMEGWVKAYRQDLKAYCLVSTVEDYIEADLDVADPDVADLDVADPCYYSQGELVTSEQIKHTLQYLAEVWELFSSHYPMPDPPPKALFNHIRHLGQKTTKEPELAQQKELPLSKALLGPDTDPSDQGLSRAVVFARENRQVIMGKFADFQTKVCDKLIKNGVDTQVFRQYVTNQFPPGDCIPPPPANMIDMFKAITYHGLWDYFHFSPLEQVVKKFCPNDPEIEGCVQTYKKDLKAYCIVITLHTEADLEVADPLAKRAKLDVADHDPPSAKRAKYDTRYYRPLEWKTHFVDHSLQYLTEVWESFSSHYLVPDSPPTALLDRVRRGCFLITWLVPSHLIKPLLRRVKVDTEFFQQHHILRVKVGDKCIYEKLTEESKLDDIVSDMKQHRCQDEDSAQYSLSPHQSSTDHLDVQNLNYDRIPRERVLIRTSLHVVDSTPKLCPKVVQKPARFQHYIAQLTAVPAVTPLPFSKAKMETAILATVMKEELAISECT